MSCLNWRRLTSSAGLYPRDGFAANLIGYVGEVSDDMLNEARYAYYEPGDVVGQSGVGAILRLTAAWPGRLPGPDCR